MIMANTGTRSRVKKSLATREPARRKRPVSVTPREQEVLELIWIGFKNKEIGQCLKISIKTVETHRAHMMAKLRVSNTAQLLRKAMQGGNLTIG